MACRGPRHDVLSHLLCILLETLLVQLPLSRKKMLVNKSNLVGVNLRAVAEKLRLT